MMENHNEIGKYSQSGVKGPGETKVPNNCGPNSFILIRLFYNAVLAWKEISLSS